MNEVLPPMTGFGGITVSRAQGDGDISSYATGSRSGGKKLSLYIVKCFTWAENLSRTEEETESTNTAHPLPKHMERQACDE